MSEEKAYNGELRQLFNDIDKRLAVLENNHEILWSRHDQEAKEHRQYVHNSFHDIKDSLATITASLHLLPCKERQASTAKDEIYISNQFKAIWSTMVLMISGVLVMAWRVLWGGK